MLGYIDFQFIEFMCLYFIIYSDYEGGNVSVYISYLVGSVFLDFYLFFVVVMNGLVGFFYGLVNQEVFVWLIQLQKEVGKDVLDEKL